MKGTKRIKVTLSNEHIALMEVMRKRMRIGTNSQLVQALVSVVYDLVAGAADDSDEDIQDTFASLANWQRQADGDLSNITTHRHDPKRKIISQTD